MWSYFSGWKSQDIASLSCKTNEKKSVSGQITPICRYGSNFPISKTCPSRPPRVCPQDHLPQILDGFYPLRLRSRWHSFVCRLIYCTKATVAQLVEHRFRKAGVVSSSLTSGFIQNRLKPQTLEAFLLTIPSSLFFRSLAWVAQQLLSVRPVWIWHKSGKFK